MTKFFKGNNKSKTIKPVPPRAMDEINKEYSELIGKLGIEQFKAATIAKNVEYYTQRLMEVNLEANNRTELDKVEKIETESAGEVK